MLPTSAAPSGQPAAQIVSDNPINGSGIEVAPVNDGDSRWQLANGGGYSVLQLQYFTYFIVSNQSVLQADALTMEITFYDDTTSQLTIQYCSTSDAHKATRVERYGTNQLVATTIALADADFDRREQDFGASFRLSDGSSIRSIKIYVGITDDTQQAPPTFAPQTASNNLIGKGVAGYQSWFRAGDNNNEWGHWGWGSESPNPSAGKLCFEIYPAVDDYLANGATLYPSKLANLGNGKDSLLFNSPDKEIIDTHFQRMKEADLDGVAIQRFYGNTSTAKSSAQNHLQVIRDSYDHKRTDSHLSVLFICFHIPLCLQALILLSS